MERRLHIAVIGGSEALQPDLDLAEAVGRELARRGAVVVCGGLGGVMEAVCRGAKAQGGTTLGILPGSDSDEANPYVDYPICTGMGYARNIVVVKSGQAVIAIDGAFGTLSEIGHALGEGIPVVGLNTWSLSRNGARESSIMVAQSPADAVEKAIEVARARAKLSHTPAN